MGSKIETMWHRMRTTPVYLITLCIGVEHSHTGGGLTGTAYPQAHAVVDDFGTLVIVRGWQ